MSESTRQSRLRILHADPSDQQIAFAEAVRAGLTAADKCLPCRFFYDREGARLFERICTLPEYYLSRAEEEILQAKAVDFAEYLGETHTVIELGSGSAEKSQILLASLLRRRRTLHYCPIDVCADVIEASSRRLVAQLAGLTITAAIGPYESGLARLLPSVAPPWLVLWLGSNIGNLDRASAADFLGRLTASFRAGDALLIGVDLRKDASMLERAYNDSQGVTAAFNKNLLARINRELGGRFELDAFEHRASYIEAAGRIEMHLISRLRQVVRIEALGLAVVFERGEKIHTEDSYKYSDQELDALLHHAGLECLRMETDAGNRFALVHARPRN